MLPSDKSIAVVLNIIKQQMKYLGQDYWPELYIIYVTERWICKVLRSCEGQIV